jgi:hypothetical protein
MPARAEVATLIVSAYSGAMALAKIEQDARPLRETSHALQAGCERGSSTSDGSTCPLYAPFSGHLVMSAVYVLIAAAHTTTGSDS